LQVKGSITMKNRGIKTRKLVLLITVTLILSITIFHVYTYQTPTNNLLPLPTQSNNPTTQTTITNSKMGTHLQQLLQSSDPSTEYEMIIFFEKTINYTQGINMLKKLGEFEIISNYTILNGICIKTPIRMVPMIAQQNYVHSITYNEKVKLASNQITTNEIQVKDIKVNDAIGATTIQNSYSLNGTGVVVAVIDTGINPHNDLPGSRIIYNQSFVQGETSITADLNGHGTAVAGIIGASGSTATGVATNVTFLNLRALDRYGEGNSGWVINAINEALINRPGVHPKADIISLSLGDPEGTSDDPVSVAVNNAWNNSDTIVVAAAGNEGGSYWDYFWGTLNYSSINSPGLAAYIITVGSTGGSNYRSVSYFSSRGPTDDYRAKPDIVAPGEYIRTLSNDGESYVSFSGTSASTPVVSGAIALLLDENNGMPWLTPNTIKAAIMMTASDLGGNPFSQGAGLINIFRAFEYLRGYYNGTNDTPPLIITPIRAISPPMTLSNASDTVLNLSIIVGNISGSTIVDVYFNVSGTAYAFTTLPSPINETLNNTQIFAQISFRVPPDMSTFNFSGTLTLFNRSGETLFNITLSLFTETPPYMYLILALLFLSSYHPVNILAIIGIVGVAAVTVIALVSIIQALRGPKPPPEFPFEEGERPPPPSEPEETDWFL
ncbi:MAG: S8 family serine peptidase, partial [Candidatus Jordarchaeaceae archaeon]